VSPSSFDVFPIGVLGEEWDQNVSVEQNEPLEDAHGISARGQSNAQQQALNLLQQPGDRDGETLSRANFIERGAVIG